MERAAIATSLLLLLAAAPAACAEPEPSIAEGGGPVGSPENRPPLLASPRLIDLGEGENADVVSIGDPDGDPVAVHIRDVTPGLSVALVGDLLHVTLGYEPATDERGEAHYTVELDDGRGGAVVEERAIRVASLGWSESARWVAANGPPPRQGAVHLVADGSLYLLFGEEDGAAVADAWRFDPGDGTWSPVALVGDVPPPGPGKRLVGGTFVHGGFGPDGEPIDDLHRVTVEAATVLAFERIEQDGAPPPRAEHVLIAGASPAGDGLGEPAEGSGPHLVLYGGLGGPREAPVALDDLWTMELVDDRARWQPVAVDYRPPARVGIAVAHDAEAGRAILFGGRAEASGPPLDATWAIDLRASGGPRFEPVAVATAPAPRSGAAAVWDPVVGRAFLFGGIGPEGAARDDALVLDERGASPAWIAVERPGAPPLGDGVVALSWVRRHEDVTPRTALWVGSGELTSWHLLAPRRGGGYGGR